MEAPLDLAAYLARIGHEGEVGPDLAGLRRLHLAHATAIPFENLDIQLGRPIRLDLDRLQAKLVGSRRGGYCFEQNTLFLAALRASGFDAMACEARVREGMREVGPRTHMVLLVHLDGQEWLADVGFGGTGPLEPVPRGGEPVEQFAWTYRMVEEDGESVLQVRGESGWQDLYAFAPERRYPVDFEVANWYTSTFPSSRFVRTLTAQRSSPEARYILRDLSYSIVRGTSVESSRIARADLVPLLRETFGIDLPEDARFRSLDEA
jgi:N-hydroxyarylamine O-acetyltransferase